MQMNAENKFFSFRLFFASFSLSQLTISRHTVSMFHRLRRKKRKTRVMENLFKTNIDLPTTTTTTTITVKSAVTNIKIHRKSSL